MIQIRVGGRYKTRSGGEVEITHDKGDRQYPFFGEIRHTDRRFERIAYFTSLGEYRMFEESVFDIVQEAP